MQMIIKKLLDRFFAVFLLIFLFPILLLIAIFIKFGGPIFFLQSRLGKDGAIFKIIKFRTMIVNADQYLDNNGSPTRNRITKIGRVLRATSLDELPQLINIVMGQMSFIGPRPTLLSHWERYTEEQKKRFKMLPGISGWAQVSGRNELPWSQRIKLDIEYIENFTLWFDLVIAYRTVIVLFSRKGIVMDRNTSNIDDLDRK
jgi:undecaprenyl phosphate N,N'-diacetylbacillosamine 1-phosphate transferase